MGWNFQLATREVLPRENYSASRPYQWHPPLTTSQPYLTAAERKKNVACGAHQRFVFSTGSGPSYCDVSLPPGVRPGITNCALVTLQWEWCWSAEKSYKKSTRTYWWKLTCLESSFVSVGSSPCFFLRLGRDSIMGGNWNAFSCFGFEKKIVPPFSS